MSKDQIIYLNQIINYNIQFNKRRKRLAIVINGPNGVIIKAPFGIALLTIKNIVKKHAGWIIKKLQNSPINIDNCLYKKEYINGASHYFLGSQYQLSIQHTNDRLANPIVLHDGCMIVKCKHNIPSVIELLMNQFYFTQANIILNKLFNECWEIFRVKHPRVKLPKLKIKLLKGRWGSCSSIGNITLNQKLIETDIECIKYVIMHELCHLIHFNHSTSFYNLLKEYSPDWKILKNKLPNRVR